MKRTIPYVVAAALSAYLIFVAGLPPVVVVLAVIGVLIFNKRLLRAR